MSYARFSDGDVYVFCNTDDFLECCGCLLRRPYLWTQSVDEMQAHLEEHLAAGHAVDIEGIMAAIRDDFPSGTTAL